MSLLESATRYLFFTGKGGVGKTSLSCAMGLALAESGKRVLIVSTDPASNLDEVLETPLSSRPLPVTGAPGLFALNIDPEASARDYRERMVAPYRGVLPATAIASMEEQFSGACTVEIAAFDEFAKLLGDRASTADFDHVIFDTAPTGHTLRLLTLPSAWSGFIASSTGGASCLGPLAGLEKQKALYADTVARLADPAQTRVVLVARADAAALREAERTRGELAELGVSNLQLFINGLFATTSSDDRIAVALAKRSAEALLDMPLGLAGLPRQVVAFLPRGTVGLAALRSVFTPSPAESRLTALPPATATTALPPALPALIDELAAAGQRHGDRRGNRRLADAALAHGHDHAASALCQFVDQRPERAGQIRTRNRHLKDWRSRGVLRSHQPQRIEPDGTARQKRRDAARQFHQPGRHRGERTRTAPMHGAGNRIKRSIIGEHAVQRQAKIGDAEFGELNACAFGLAQRRGIGTADQHDGRLRRIGQALHGRGVQDLLFLQSGQRAEAGSTTRRIGDELAPCRRQRQQAQRMAGRCGVENDVIEFGRALGLPEQLGELVEGGDFHRARAGELLFHTRNRRRRQDATIRRDHALAVVVRCGFRVDVQRKQAVRAGYGGRRLAQRDAQHFVKVRRRIGTDDQHPLSSLGQRRAGGTGKRGLANTALAGEKEITGVDLGQRHQQHPDFGLQQPLPILMRGLSSRASAMPSFCASCARDR